MIKLSIEQKSLDELNKELNLKYAALNSIINQSNIEQISRAAYVILKNRFLPAVDTHSRLNPKKMHHIYEWGKTGHKESRLFVLEKVAFVNNSLVVSSRFLPSKTFVPIPRELQRSGKTGKVVRARHIFRNKADMMENGKPVRLESRKMMAFLGRNGIQFIQPNTTINILNPGGKQVTHSFEKFMFEWYSRNAQSIMDSSNLYPKIVDETIKVLDTKNSGITDVQLAIKRVVDSFVGGMEAIQ